MLYGVTPEYSVLQTCSTATSSAESLQTLKYKFFLIVQILKYELSMEIMPAVSLLPGLANLFIF
jgi:hypothetical protein